MKITVNVTQKHIDNGKKDEPHCCPIALALKETKAIHVSVGNQFTSFVDDKGIWRAGNALPEKAINFIKDFDNGLCVKPMTFDLKLNNKIKI